ncbi:MAG: Crp/Fnr family transcriptional regulator [Ferruginibacter sp.]
MPSWLPAIEANRQSLHYKKGELLFKEGEDVKGMFFIHTGLVKVHKRWDEDKELILRVAGNGDIVGHRGIGADTIYPVSGTALEATEVCFISLDFFNDTLKVNHEFLYQLMMFFAAELKESEKRMRNLAHMTVKGRIASAILTLKKKFGATDGDLNIILSRQDFASYVGATYETVFRVTNELIEEKAISMDGKQITILSDGLLLDCIKD